jgi:hypothetical protein
MFLFFKNFLLVISLLFFYGCASNNSNFVNTDDMNSVSIETNEDRDNLLFKENLKRLFKTKKNVKFKLITSISFSSSNTLSVGGLNVLTRTVASVSYKLYDFKTNQLIKSGSLQSFPALGSTSSSLYSSDTNLKHIKERLNISASKKLYMHLIIVLRRLK